MAMFLPLYGNDLQLCVNSLLVLYDNVLPIYGIDNDLLPLYNN